MSGTHANPLGLKTDAPPEVMWDIMRCWVAEHPSKKPLDPDSYEGFPFETLDRSQACFAVSQAQPPQQEGTGLYKPEGKPLEIQADHSVARQELY